MYTFNANVYCRYLIIPKRASLFLYIILYRKIFWILIVYLKQNNFNNKIIKLIKKKLNNKNNNK